MTLTEISAQKQKIEKKHIRNMWMLKFSFIFEFLVAIFMAIIDMRTSTSENPVATGFVVMLVLAVIATAWNLLLFYVFKRGRANEIAKLDAAELRLKAQQKYAQEQREARDRTRAAQDALISLAKSKEQELNTHPTNCPNCGALLNGSVCSYCGTRV